MQNSLFGSVKLTKNTDPDKYCYSAYGISFDVRRTFSLTNDGFGKKVIMFGANMSSSVHVDNKITFLIKVQRKGYTILYRLQKLNTLLIFAEQGKDFCLSLH